MRNVTFHNPNRWDLSLTLVVVVLCATVLAAWVTHIVWIISALASPLGATFGQMALGFLGAFMPPFGVIHGFMIWFGAGF